MSSSVATVIGPRHGIHVPHRGRLTAGGRILEAPGPTAGRVVATGAPAPAAARPGQSVAADDADPTETEPDRDPIRPRPQLLALVPGGEPADGHRAGRPAARRRPAALRAVARSGSRPGSARSWPRGPSRCRLDLEVTEETACDGYRRRRIVFDTEDTMSVPAYLLVPDGRPAPGSAVLAVHGHGPGKSRMCGLEPEGAPGSDYAAELARRGHVVLAPGPALLRRAGRLEPARPLRLRHQPGPPGHGRMEPADPEPVGPGPCPRRARGPSAGRPGPDRHGRLLLRGHDDAVPRRHWTLGWPPPWSAATSRRGREAHKVPWNMCGSQVLFGMLGRMEHADLGALVAPRPLLVGRPRRPALPGGRRRGVGGPAAAGLRPLRCRRPLVHDIFDGEHQWHGAAGLSLPRPLAGSPDRGAART